MCVRPAPAGHGPSEESARQGKLDSLEVLLDFAPVRRRRRGDRATDRRVGVWCSSSRMCTIFAVRRWLP